MIATLPQAGCSLLRLADDEEKILGPADYQGQVARWCSGCGDHSVLAAVQRLLAAEELRPETTVFVSGIGCSSRFPHYMRTYGFHGIHGRALPVATGVELTRPDLDVFVVMGDGDCVSIGAGHWVHAVRYNVDMVALLLDNSIYGLTKKQTSPTTPRGYASNTHPRGAPLPPMNPLAVTLGITNVSFVAQTAEWVPAHLFATLRAARRHRGFSFVRVLQRCPHFTPDLFSDLVRDPSRVELLVHRDGIDAPGLERVFEHRRPHDPADLDEARRLAAEEGSDPTPGHAVVRLGLFFRDESRPRYDDLLRPGGLTAAERTRALEEELDRHAV